MLTTVQREALAREAARWLGTPFREHTEICGVGADCVHLTRGVLTGAGFSLPEIDVADYPLDWARHRSHSLVIEWIERSGKFRLVAEGEGSQPGDVLCIKQGKCSHHVAVAIDERQFLHTRSERFAEYGLLDDPNHAGLLAGVYRLREVEQA